MWPGQERSESGETEERETSGINFGLRERDSERAVGVFTKLIRGEKG